VIFQFFSFECNFYLYLRDAFIHWKITANYLCVVNVSVKHVKLLLQLLLQAIINYPFVNWLLTQRIFTIFLKFCNICEFLRILKLEQVTTSQRKTCYEFSIYRAHSTFQTSKLTSEGWSRGKREEGEGGEEKRESPQFWDVAAPLTSHTTRTWTKLRCSVISRISTAKSDFVGKYCLYWGGSRNKSRLNLKFKI